MSPLAFYRQMITSGMDEATAYRLAEQFETEEGAKAEARYEALLSRIAKPIDKAADRRREWDRQRKAEQLAARKSGGNPVESTRTQVEPVEIHPTKDAPAPVHTRGENNLSRLEDTGLVVVGGVGAREPEPQTDDWPSGDASAHARQIVQHIASPWLDPQKSPDLITTRGRLAAWKREGASWVHDVLPTVEGLCANRRSAISSWKFFDAAMGRSVSENRAALQIPEAQARAPPRRQTLAEQVGDEQRRATELTMQRLKARANG